MAFLYGGKKLGPIARKNAAYVVKNLGYNNIEFKQGFLESIPIENISVDLVTSNCVINLSTKKVTFLKKYIEF